MSVDANLLRIVSEDRALGSAMLFGHRHSEESAPMHVEMLDLWPALDEFIMIEAFRDGAKSTLAEESLIMEGCFGNFHYWLLIGETYPKAVQRLEAIDYECRTNVKLHHLFGGPVLARKSLENKVFFKSGAMIQCVGWEQELQSFKRQQYRPDGAWLDDIENQERVRDQAAVKAGLRKFWLELVPALDKKRRRIRFTQTRRAEYCMVTVFAKSAEWLYRGYPVATGDIDDPRTQSNWPAKYSMAWIRSERDRFAADGMLQEFQQAYMLKASNPEAKPFKESQLVAIEASGYEWAPKVAIYDPARTNRASRTRELKASDRYGKVVASRVGSQIVVHESQGAHWKPNEMLEDVFACDNKHHPVKIGVEKNSLDEWIMQPLRMKMLDKGHPVPLVGLYAPQDRSKEEFILGLQPFAEAGDIVLVGGRARHAQLVAEWANFPDGTRDILNALAYTLRMFSATAVYPDFSGIHVQPAPNAARGETVYVGFNANTSETVWVAGLREGRRFCVRADGVGMGPDAVADALANIRAAFPLAAFSIWAPADVHDQWQRIPLVTQLRAARVSVQRGEHTASARGSLTQRLRTDYRGKRGLTVDRQAARTLNALSMGYAYPTQRGGRVGVEPEEGTSKLIGEALECVVAMLDAGLEAEGFPQNANLATSPGGAPYVTANPNARR